MMTMLEDLRLALRQICQAMGLRGNAATVVSLIVLGVALNITALRVVEYAGIGRHVRHNRTVLRSAARTELKVVRTVVVSTLKKIGDGGRRWCSTRQGQLNQTTDGVLSRIKVGFVWVPPSNTQGCDVEVVGIHHRTMAISFVQC
jgi:hypothetical protein